MRITREDVWLWLQDYDGDHKKKDKKLHDYLDAKVKAKNLPDDMVDVSQRDDFIEDEVPVLDMILADIDSYE
jgi:hypothetical protein